MTIEKLFQILWNWREDREDLNEVEVERAIEQYAKEYAVSELEALQHKTEVIADKYIDELLENRIKSLKGEMR